MRQSEVEAPVRPAKPRLIWVEAGACAFLALLLLAKGIAPGWHTLHTDFPNYYLVARLLREGYPLDRVYDWVWLQRIKDHWGIAQPLVGFAGLTPFSALPLVPFAFFSALAAKRLWIVFNLLLLGVSAEALHRQTSLGRRRVWLLCLLCIFPLRTDFLLGQMHLLVLVLFALAYAADRRGQPWLCAICLSIGGMLKVYPFLFAAYFAWKRKWTELFAMCAATACLLGASAIVCGTTVTHTWLVEVLPRSLVGEVLDPYSPQSASLAALFHRLFVYEPQLNPAPWHNSPVLYALLYPLCQLAVLIPFFTLVSRDERSREPLEWATLVCILLLLSPVPASYHFVVLAFSMVLLADFLRGHHKKKVVAVALLLYVLLSAAGVIPPRFGNVFMAFARLWVIAALTVLLLLCQWRYRSGSAIPRPPLRMLMAIAAVSCWIIAALHYRHHLTSVGEDMKRRLAGRPSAYLSTGPKKTQSGFVFTAMMADGYQIVDQNGPVLPDSAADELTAAASPSGVVEELADANGSNLVATSAPQVTLQANGEAPALTSDGKTLAFLREEQGRGGLWIASMPSGNPRRLTDEVYDVYSFSLGPSGRVVIAARFAGKLSLFQLTAGQPLQPLLPGIEDVDTPSISPDERSLAFTHRVHGLWQLESLDLVTLQRKTLVSEDCSLYSPQWLNPGQLAYATDCGRGLGLTALATIKVDE